MSPVCRFAWIVCVACSVASVAAAPLIEPASGREFRADYGLPVRHVTPGDLGLGPKDVVRVGLSTRFDEALVQLAVQGLVNRSAPLMWIDNAPVDWGHGEET